MKQLPSHKTLNTTLQYIQLVNLPQEEKFICKVATKPDEAVELIEAGFEYVTGEYADGGKLFRKRKVKYLGSPSIPVGSWSSLDPKFTGDIPRKPHFSRRGVLKRSIINHLNDKPP